MSSDYRLNLIWTSHGAQLRADIERNIGGLVGFDRTIQRHNRQLGLWGQQMRAVGTTIRYALAGATVYSVATSVAGLGQFLDRLGEIDALAARIDNQGRLQSLGRGLNELGDHAIMLSNRWGMAVDDILQHQQRFQSSFTPAVDQSIAQTKEWADQMAVLTMALGSEAGDPTALSGGVAGMIQGMGPRAIANPALSAKRLSNIITQVIAETPNILGTDISRDIGRLSGAQVSLRMTPEQIFAVYGTAARAGGSTAVIGRGVTQLLTAELVNPQTEEQKQAFRRMGLPADPGSLRQMGGWNILMHLLQRFEPPSGAQTKVLGQIDDPEEALAAAGIPKQQVNLLFGMFGRMESARQFMNLLGMGGVKALQDFIDGINEAIEVDRARQMADIRNEQRAYQQLSQTYRNVGLTIARGVDPVTRPIARGFNRFGGWLTEQNPAAVAGGVAAAGGASLAARLIFGMGLTGLAGRGLGRIPGVGKMAERMGLGRLLGRAPNLAATALVGSGLGAFQATGMQGAGSRSNPFWVVIDPLSWFMPGAPSGTGGTGPTAPGTTPRGPRRAPAALRRAATIALPALAAGAPLIVAEELDARRQARNQRQHFHASIHRALAYALSTDAGGFGATGKEARILSLYRAEKINAPTANRRLMQLAEYAEMFGQRRVAGTGLGFVQQLHGEAGVTIMLDATPELKAALLDINRREKVPVKLWPKAQGGTRPTFRGQQKTQRRGGA